MMILIKNIEVYAPEYLGKKDVLVSGGEITAIEDEIVMTSSLPIKELDGSGNYLFPGFIDAHVHITGGGGEAGFSSRTPEIMLSDIIRGGVTTVIGTLGTDGTTRTMTNLLAKANALEEEGITAYIQSGSYQLPVRTLTDSVINDLILIEKVIGVGEIAIADHRSSHPTVAELTRLASDVRLGAMLAGKVGTLNIHMGDSRQMLDLIRKVTDTTEIPKKHFVPTHMNRNPYLFEESIRYAEEGGNVDYTTSTVPLFIEEGEVPAYHTLKLLKENGVPLDNVTFTSDGQGSLPLFDEAGELKGCDVGKVTTLYESVKDAVHRDGMAVEEVLPVITSNPARIYGLKKKGNIREGFDADLVLVRKSDLQMEAVIAKGRLMAEGGEVTVKGMYE